MQGNFDSLISDSKPVIVDFHALWCGPCKAQAPVLKDVATFLGEKVRVLKINVDENPAIASRYRVKSVPTLIIFKNGEVKYRQAGLHTKDQLLKLVDRYL
jgi:thioredoxin 1